MATTDYNDGKVHGWNGGDCPVHPYSVVVCWLRNGDTIKQCDAGGLAWDTEDDDDASYDIIAFQVVTPCVEPKTIWVNEYKHGSHGYSTEAEAKGEASYDIIACS